ncbi:MAG: hypothetical protein ABJD68_09490 [Nakamurella sp.]
MRFIGVLIVLIFIAVICYGVVGMGRAVVVGLRQPRRDPPRQLPRARVVRRAPWEARYVIEGPDTVWFVVREVLDESGVRTEDSQEVGRISSDAADFEEQFRAAEQRSHDRAFLLNSTLSP